MTTKSAKKTAARARKEALGGKYQAHWRQLDAGASLTKKYVHVEHGTPDGTRWVLSDNPVGAVLEIAVPNGPLTPEMEEAAFARAVYPLISETSSDAGKTWVQHLDAGAQHDWRASRRLVYGLLGTGGGTWNAVRIRARTGEELLRHPPRLLQEIAERISADVNGVDLTLRAPNDQLFVRVDRRMFAMATSMKRATTWPVYVTPIPPPSETSGSWECFTIEDALATLRWPDEQPTLRVATINEIRAGIIGTPESAAAVAMDVPIAEADLIERINEVLDEDDLVLVSLEGDEALEYGAHVVIAKPSLGDTIGWGKNGPLHSRLERTNVDVTALAEELGIDMS